MSDAPLVIEYVLDGANGHQRGYNFTSSTAGYDNAVLKVIWQNAMARGQGWGAYTGARSIKAFPIPDGMIAISEMTVTDATDEGGRRGIRRAVIDIMPQKLFGLHLRSRLAGYPPAVLAVAAEQVRLCQNRANRLKRDKPLVIMHPYHDARAWWVMEALVLKLIQSPAGAMARWGDFIPFTTLALDYRGESPVVALPQATTAQIDTPITTIL